MPEVPAVPAHWTNRPVAMVTPASETELTNLVRSLEANGAGLVTVGGGTHWTTGNPPRADRPYVLLSTRRLNRILDHQPDDMTVTCEPGVTLTTLQARLATHRQFLPLDTPLPERATLGGIVATNRSGFRRLVYGAPRDLVIGVRAVMHAGEQIKGGGKVVKNVAGYDVCKLFTGSWGSVGVISEITFKVYPMPEGERLLRLAAPDLATAARTALALHHAQLAPTSLLVTNELPDAPGVATLLALLSGPETRLEWQTREIERLTNLSNLSNLSNQALGAPELAPTTTLTTLWNQLARLAPDTSLGGRLSCLLTEVAPLLATLQSLPDTRLTADCAMGVLHFATGQADANFLSAILKATPTNGNLLWTRMDSTVALRPDIIAHKLNLWGVSRETTTLQQTLKSSLDPEDTFNPGRFIV